MIQYPITLVILDHALVIGGGAVATRKVQGLLDAGAPIVTVIAPQLTAQLETWVAQERVIAIRRAYAPGDLANARVVIAATDDTRVNEAVWREARERGILVNAVDDPPHCTFHVPAVVRRGDLTIAISTGGASPALAKHLRHEIERVIGDEYAQLATLLAQFRPRINAHVPHAKREQLWDALIKTALPLLREECEADARALMEEIVARYET
ncbi:MAG: bifunctional precorrin-2 dehydrogenase/sirohydrochlorin ferrochelatase [Chloroflexi bacterium]|nr:bifunctional precorrin-2 dehydrogenase/sirohydrochlorin ferrochelatase [Chloroflexota bacterium]